MPSMKMETHLLLLQGLPTGKLTKQTSHFGEFYVAPRASVYFIFPKMVVGLVRITPSNQGAC